MLASGERRVRSCPSAVVPITIRQHESEHERARFETTRLIDPPDCMTSRVPSGAPNASWSSQNHILFLGRRWPFDYLSASHIEPPVRPTLQMSRAPRR